MRFIGLGGDCQVAHHIKRLDASSEKHFFDWLVIPAETVAALIETEFAAFLEEEDLEPTIRQGRLREVTNLRNGTRLLHDFKEFDQDNIRRVQEKYRYLSHKFTTMLGDGAPATFIRRWHSVDVSKGEESARRLLSILQRYKPASHLIFLHQESDRTPLIDGPYRSAYIPQIPGEWTGDEAAWTDIITRFSTAECVDGPAST